jgi:hypothetical protein
MFCNPPEHNKDQAVVCTLLYHDKGQERVVCKRLLGILCTLDRSIEVGGNHKGAELCEEATDEGPNKVVLNICLVGVVGGCHRVKVVLLLCYE